MNCTCGFCECRHFVMAAVSVVFPWSMCPMVPTFTCSFVRTNFCLATGEPSLTLLPPHPKDLEPTTRVELVTSSLPRTRSDRLSYVGPGMIEDEPIAVDGCVAPALIALCPRFFRAHSPRPQYPPTSDSRHSLSKSANVRRVASSKASSKETPSPSRRRSRWASHKLHRSTKYAVAT